MDRPRSEWREERDASRVSEVQNEERQGKQRKARETILIKVRAFITT